MKITANNFSLVMDRLHWMAMGSVGLLLISNISWGILFWNLSRNADQKVFVRSGKSMFAASLESENDARSIHQARGLVESFAKLMFENDAQNFKERVDEGLWFITELDGQAIYKGFLDQRVLENYNKYNAFAQLRIDSIGINTATIPYKCTLLMQQELHYDDKIVPNPIGATFELQPSLYSDKNPFGLMINHFTFIKYAGKENE